MKKLFTILFFVVIATNAFSQQNCQAYFTYSYNPAGNTVYLYDQSYSLDSSQINVTTWTWTVQYYGVSYTYSTQNPIIQLTTVPPSVPVCLTITTPTCQSTFCDTIFLNTLPVDSCIAAFTYQADSVLNNYNFYDNSYTNNGTINSWTWVVYASNSTVLFTSNLQNPSFIFPGNGIYQVCLTIYSDSGCQTSICDNIYIQDTINPNCQLNVTANIGHVTVPGGNDGFIELTVTGGTPPYNYDWLNINLHTQNIYNLTSGIYMVNVTSADPACPAVTYTAQILEPYDSSNYVVDTLYTNIIDTCFGYAIDSFYIDSIFISDNNLVTVVWVFSGGGMNSTLYTTYTYYLNGSQIVVLTINCDSAKNLATYSGYIYIGPTMGVNAEDPQPTLLIYPNPVTDMLNIDFGQSLSGENSLQIYSASGQLVYDGSLPAGSANFRIDVSFLKKGIYFVKYEDGSGKYVTSKFLK